MTSRRLPPQKTKVSWVAVWAKVTTAHFGPDVHPVVATDKVAVVRLSVFEFDQLRRNEPSVSARDKRACGGVI